MCNHQHERIPSTNILELIVEMNQYYYTYIFTHMFIFDQFSRIQLAFMNHFVKQCSFPTKYLRSSVIQNIKNGIS